MRLTRLFIYVYAGGLVPVLPNVFFKGSLQRTTWQKAEFSPSLLFSHGPTQSAFRPIRLTKIVFNLYTDLISSPSKQQEKESQPTTKFINSLPQTPCWFGLFSYTVHHFQDKKRLIKIKDHICLYKNYFEVETTEWKCLKQF